LIKKVDPNRYLAFKLKPVLSSDPNKIYNNALEQLNSQLQQLMNDHTVDFKPEQVKFVMGVLEIGLDQMEQNVAAKQRQVTGKDKISYTRQGSQVTNNFLTQRKDELLRPVQNSKTIYRLTYPDQQQTLTKHNTVDERLNNPQQDNTRSQEYAQTSMTPDQDNYIKYSNTLTRILKRRKKDINKIVKFIKQELKKRKEKAMKTV
jgi:hypothetical protein